MIIHVNLSHPTPAFEQVRSQLSGMIASGALEQGSRLPPIRQLAHDLDLAPGTIARVYRELETEGLVTSRVGRGTTVSAAAPMSAVQAQLRLAQAAQEFARTARQLHIDFPAADSAWRYAWGHLDHSRGLIERDAF